MVRVLIVEDDPMVAMINEQYVLRHGQFQVVGKCADGNSALAFLQQHPVDLVILDVYMPKTNGLALLKRIRELGLPLGVIMVTAANDASTLEEALRYGAVDYLVKPFAFDRFQGALEKYLARAERLHSAGALRQENIDSILEGVRAPSAPPPKGIQDQTLRLILNCLPERSEIWMTGDQIAEQTGLSAVTVRRYLNHLIQTGEVRGEMDYETGGRPKLLYRRA
ncbi:MAG: response regulator [Oscillospiraceae bacterium]|nr:response regulator [Oscillospiraceae bacterium]